MTDVIEYRIEGTPLHYIVAKVYGRDYEFIREGFLIKEFYTKWGAKRAIAKDKKKNKNPKARVIIVLKD